MLVDENRLKDVEHSTASLAEQPVAWTACETDSSRSPRAPASVLSADWSRPDCPSYCCGKSAYWSAWLLCCMMGMQAGGCRSQAATWAAYSRAPRQ